MALSFFLASSASLPLHSSLLPVLTLPLPYSLPLPPSLSLPYPPPPPRAPISRTPQAMIKNIQQTTETPNGPERSTMFYMGLGAAMREGVPSYIYMFPLGGAYESKNLPLPAVLGE